MCLFEQMRRAFHCLVCMVVAGPILVIIGIVVLAGATEDSRSPLITKYNNAVEQWNDGLRDEFNAALSGELYASGDTVHYLEMKASTTADDGAQAKGGEDVKSPDVLKFRNMAITFATSSVEPWSSSMGSQAYRTIELTDEDEDTVYGTVTFPLLYSDYEHSTSSSCNSNKGYYDSYYEYCYYYWVAEEVCTQFVTSAMALKGEDSGCYYKAQGSGDNWSPVQYKKIDARNNYQPYVGAIGSMEVTVRDSNDPYIELERLTHGTLNFGLTQAEQAGIGIALVVIGCLLTIPTVLVIMYIVRRNKQERYAAGGYVQAPAYTRPPPVQPGFAGQQGYAPPQGQQQGYAPQGQQQQQGYAPQGGY